jgi:hypothetical protein
VAESLPRLSKEIPMRASSFLSAGLVLALLAFVEPPKASAFG